tara:strand:+ start:194 stop:517 length:324 start_codon:yes stop_codon:yes gene_type:complete
MEMPIAEIVDRFTILCVKRKHDISCEQELEVYKKACSFVDISLVKDLREINELMWDMENDISHLLAEESYARAGVAYGKLREMTLKRNCAKNLIAAKYGGNKNIKKY